MIENASNAAGISIYTLFLLKPTQMELFGDYLHKKVFKYRLTVRHTSIMPNYVTTSRGNKIELNSIEQLSIYTFLDVVLVEAYANNNNNLYWALDTKEGVK